MTSLYRNRGLYSGTMLLNDLQKEDGDHFKQCCRMSYETFNQLLTLVEPKIRKEDTKFRKAIPSNERLALTLRYLASGDSFASLSLVFKISKSSISHIIPEVCTAIIEVLQDYIQIPKTQEEWLSVGKKYEDLWNFPHCIGAIDGKHVQLQAPIGSGSNFLNYKSTFSIVLMAVVDADYNFLYADVGCQGRISDGGVFRSTSFFKQLEEQKLEIPPAEKLIGREKAVPYVFVADEAFPLKENIPYPGSHENGSAKRIFNYRLSRARRVVENVFGILSAVFRVFRKPMLLEPKKAELVVMACVYLHNFLRKEKASRDIYSPTDLIDHEIEGQLVRGTWREDIQSNIAFTPMQRVGRRSPRFIEENRNEFAEYFSSSGAVPWQSKLA
ncbi:hypothetical protein QTP88_019234 [Uroleucon formosanum]